MASSNSAYILPSSSSSSSRSSSWLSGLPSPLSVSSEPIMPRRPKEPVCNPRDASSVPPQMELKGEGEGVKKNKRMRLESLDAPGKAGGAIAAAGTFKGATPQSPAASPSEAATPGTSAQRGSSRSPASPATRQAKPRGAAADRSVGSAPESRSKAVAPTSAAAAAHESEATSSGSSRGDDDEDDDDLSMEAASSAASPATSVSAAGPSSSAQLSGINGRQSEAASAALRNRAARVGLEDLERQLTPQCAEPLSCDALEALEKKLWQRVLGCDDLATFRWGDGEYSGVDLFGSFNGTVQMIELHVREGRRGPYCCPWDGAFGERRYWPFWYHVQGPDDGRSVWNLSSQQSPSIAKAIFLEGKVMQAPQQSDGDSNDGESSSDEDCGCGCSCSHHQKPTQQELFEECDSPVKALRVSDFVEVLSYRLLRNGFKLEELTFHYAKEEVWIEVTPYIPAPT